MYNPWPLWVHSYRYSTAEWFKSGVCLECILQLGDSNRAAPQTGKKEDIILWTIHSLLKGHPTMKILFKLYIPETIVINKLHKTERPKRMIQPSIPR